MSTSHLQSIYLCVCVYVYARVTYKYDNLKLTNLWSKDFGPEKTLSDSSLQWGRGGKTVPSPSINGSRITLSLLSHLGFGFRVECVTLTSHIGHLFSFRPLIGGHTFDSVYPSQSSLFAPFSSPFSLLESTSLRRTGHESHLFSVSFFSYGRQVGRILKILMFVKRFRHGKNPQNITPTLVQDQQDTFFETNRKTNLVTNKVSE